MSSDCVKLLEAAIEIAGGRTELARRLGIAEGDLARFVADERRLSDSLLLKVVDIVLAERLPSGHRVEGKPS